MAEENTDTLDDVDLKIGVLNPEAVQIESEDGSVLIDFDPYQCNWLFLFDPINDFLW